MGERYPGQEADGAVNVEENRKLRAALNPCKSQLWVKTPCLPGTRTKVLSELALWARDNSHEAPRVFWIHGVAGCGKSAVAVTISQCLNDSRRLSGTFFCKREEEERRNPFRLLGSLAYYFASSNRSFKVALLELCEGNDVVAEKDLHLMAERWLKTPLTRTKYVETDAPVVFVIDALDECASNADIGKILIRVASIARWIKLIVTSRHPPNYYGAQTESQNHVRSYDLFEDDATADIQAYILDEVQHGTLASIRSQLTDARLNGLASRSRSIFIWIYTAMEFIGGGSTNDDKVRRLEIVVHSPPGGATDTGIYAIYATVLDDASQASDSAGQTVCWIVGTLLIASDKSPLSIGALHAFLPPSLNVSFRELVTIILRLKPVLMLTPASMPEAYGHVGWSELPGPDHSTEKSLEALANYIITAYHISFLDYCSSPSLRFPQSEEIGNQYWTNPSILHRNMAIGCLEIMGRGARQDTNSESTASGLRFNICDLESSHVPNSEVDNLKDRVAMNISSQLQYSCKYWVDHLNRSTDGEADANEIDSNHAVIRTMLGGFLHTERSFFWLEVMSLVGCIGMARNALIEFCNNWKETVRHSCLVTILILTDY